MAITTFSEAYKLAESKMKEIVPGTFRHCLNVTHLCEMIGKELDLDIEILKSAAILHDIGKVVNPNYFSENQSEVNPHDKLDPFISYQFITRHIADSVLICIQNNVDKRIIENVSQHHGNTILVSIFNKAKEKNNSTPEDNFRYRSTTPNSSEAAILMIVDNVEAIAKSKFNNGELTDTESKVDIIDSTIERLITDGQLDELKIGVVRIIKEVLLKEINSIYHKRVNYSTKVIKKDDPKETNELITS